MSVLKQLRLFNQINADLKRIENELIKFVKNSEYPLITDSATHLLAAGGKRLRPAFALLSGKIYGYQIEKLMPIAMALELIHMASLVHDDVVDASATRRGKPTVRANWGNTISMATGDYLLAKSLGLIAMINNPQVSRILAETSVQMSQGEIQQIRASFDVNQSIKQYYYRIKRKTALLISASCKLGALVSGAPKREIWALGAYGHSLGIAFQIVDDILDLTADQQVLGKPIGGDLRQGIMTLPMIIALKTSEQKSRLRALLAKVDKTEDEILEAIELIKQTKGIEESRRLVDRYIKKAKNYLLELPASPTRNALADLAEFVGERKY